MTPDEPGQRDGAGGRDGKLENRTLWQRVHEHLRQEILDNRLPPGSELNEVALSQSLGVSRGPVREALGRLASEGLVTVRPRRGAVVTALSRPRVPRLPTRCARRSRRWRSGWPCRASRPTTSSACRRSSTRWSSTPTGTTSTPSSARTPPSTPPSSRPRQRDAAGDDEPAARPDGPLPDALRRAARLAAALDRRAQGDPARGARRATPSAPRACSASTSASPSAASRPRPTKEVVLRNAS